MTVENTCLLTAGLLVVGRCVRPSTIVTIRSHVEMVQAFEFCKPHRNRKCGRTKDFCTGPISARPAEPEDTSIGRTC